MTALVTGLWAVAASAGAPPADAPVAVKDAWADARLETIYALNPHLAGYRIEVRVQDGVAHLSGTLESEIDRDLVLEIAESLEDLETVEHSLRVDSAIPGADARRVMEDRLAEPDRRSLGQWVTDATTTARVRSNLVTNGNTKDLSIEVDTENDVVTLKGAVPSRKEKMLAEMIARNTDGIANVRNKLDIVERT